MREYISSESDDNDMYSLRSANVTVAELREMLVRDIDFTMHDEKRRTNNMEHTVMRQRKRDFINTMRGVQEQISDVTQMLRFKMDELHTAYDDVQIAVIAQASFAVFLSSLNGILSNFGMDSGLNDSVPNVVAASIGAKPVGILDRDALNLVFQLTTLILVVSMGFVTAFAKFRGWKESADNMSSIDAKGVYVAKQLEKLIMNAGMINMLVEVDRAEASFIATEYSLALDVLSDMNNALKLKTQVEQQPKYYGAARKHRQQTLDHERLLQRMMHSDVSFIAQQRARETAARTAHETTGTGTGTHTCTGTAAAADADADVDTDTDTAGAADSGNGSASASMGGRRSGNTSRTRSRVRGHGDDGDDGDDGGDDDDDDDDDDLWVEGSGVGGDVDNV
jgi:hypothetical protein